ncbi:MAG: type III-B CRISPR module RAMP protein Cmr6 [Treponema sp.]|nr:type III-B CRISPR module RAMP protein Cmr6 [Treponema sp.]
MTCKDKKEAENNFYIYSPDYQRKYLENSKTCNFGMFFQKMVRWQNDKGNISKDNGEESYYTGKYDKKGKPEIKKEKVRKDYMEFLCRNELLANAKGVLDKKNFNQVEYLKSLDKKNTSFSFSAKSISPFITGLGSGHPTETGMILDRNTGVPYIPASSIKGVCLLAYAINIAKKGMADEKGNITLEGMKKIEELFGTQDENAKEKKRGQLVFLDAFPDAIPKLTVDIMNPHFGRYYDGTNKQPVETESPVPIKFLTVKEGVVFTFRCYFLPLGEGKRESEKSDISEEVNAIFKTAFETVGFGGKTSIGYGRFKLKC